MKPPVKQPDFFAAAYADIPIRDQRDTMERPFFSLAKKPRKTAIEYEVGGVIVKVYPVKEFGIATIWDADVLIWAASTLHAYKRRGVNDLPEHADPVVEAGHWHAGGKGEGSPPAWSGSHGVYRTHSGFQAAWGVG